MRNSEAMTRRFEASSLGKGRPRYFSTTPQKTTSQLKVLTKFHTDNLLGDGLHGHGVVFSVIGSDK